MSRNKCIQFGDRILWAFDNSHDIAVATLVEQVRKSIVSTELKDVVDNWAVQACVSDYSLELDANWTASTYKEVFTLLESSKSVVLAHGDYHSEEIESWELIPNARVSDGFLRSETLSARLVVEVLDGITELIRAQHYNGPVQRLGYPCD